MDVEEKSTITDTETIKKTETTTDASQNVSAKNTTKQKVIKVDKQETKIQEETYSIQDFKENSKALSYSKEVVAGALFNCKETKLTRTQFEEKIKNFLGKKVE